MISDSNVTFKELTVANGAEQYVVGIQSLSTSLLPSRVFEVQSRTGEGAVFTGVLYMLQTDYQPGQFTSRRPVYILVNPLVNGLTHYIQLIASYMCS